MKKIANGARGFWNGSTQSLPGWKNRVGTITHNDSDIYPYLFKPDNHSSRMPCVEEEVHPLPAVMDIFVDIITK